MLLEFIRQHVTYVMVVSDTSNALLMSDGLCMTASWKVAGGSCGKAASAASVTRLNGTDVLSTCGGGGRHCSDPACGLMTGQHDMHPDPYGYGREHRLTLDESGHAAAAAAAAAPA